MNAERLLPLLVRRRIEELGRKHRHAGAVHHERVEEHRAAQVLVVARAELVHAQLVECAIEQGMTGHGTEDRVVHPRRLRGTRPLHQPGEEVDALEQLADRFQALEVGVEVDAAEAPDQLESEDVRPLDGLALRVVDLPAAAGRAAGCPRPRGAAPSRGGGAATTPDTPRTPAGADRAEPTWWNTFGITISTEIYVRPLVESGNVGGQASARGRARAAADVLEDSYVEARVATRRAPPAIARRRRLRLRARTWPPHSALPPAAG